MILYSILLFLVAVPVAILSIAIYRGKTNLIHDYHQTKVTDPAAYGKAFGKAMFVISLGLLLSGIIGLFGDMIMAMIILFVGLGIGIGGIIAVQKKYNQGVF